MTDGEGYSLADQFHGEASNWLFTRNAGEPGIEDKLAIWLEADPRHREAFDEAERVWGGLRELKRSEMRPFGIGSERLGRAPFYMRRSTHIAVGVAASIALACFAAIALASNPYIPELITPASAATYKTGLGEIRTFRLTDGPSITLDTDTEVRVGGHRGEQRLFLLKGRIRVDGGVGARQFVVATPQGSVRVDGPVFDAANVDQRLQIAAPAEAIAVTGDVGGMSELKLSLGEGIEFANGRIAASHSNRGWPSGMLALDGARLDDAVAALNRYNRTKLVLAGNNLGRRPISGAFRVSEPGNFAAVIARMYDLRIDRSQRDQIRLSPPI
ncbi:FecR domain-containing protein [Novosphingobium sp. TCA1]|uniref:FecR family protein n=1 Tax=Novosphingobium sp. TCA1 TaxID=2682474 RepID=UPI00130C475D|nr:FecR domain-containing protein [Novosphingobium sp. TCA1]GFE76133.1 sensor [Novosphingobium sp. TCA1]